VKILETERLNLRRLSVEDNEFILKLLNEPAFMHNIGDRKVRTPDAARAYILKRVVASYEQNGFGLWAVDLKESGEPIGMCGLIKRDALDDVDIGYAFLSKFWSKGYATEATLAVKQYAQQVIGLKRLAAIVDPDNQSSIRVLEKIGLKFEKMIHLPNDEIELKLFAADL
jgi:RimJ/RimL family protein N-acetyltransferase